MTFKRRFVWASILYIIPWGFLGASYLLWHFAAPNNPYEPIAKSALNYFGILPFEANLINISALTFAIALGYGMFLGLYFGIDKVMGWEHEKWLK